MGLLKNLDPVLSAELLWVLRVMGHGDRLAIVDCNFPASDSAYETTLIPAWTQRISARSQSRCAKVRPLHDACDSIVTPDCHNNMSAWKERSSCFD
mmetsp:Transcript_14116/g.56266  ORF Transcript_14116/g.56266 Transcript_14116/m.56266 type:complete len:96 (+) Transcript_14116:63-350(+)